ncbi:MAG TPA: hypothetical protein VFW85_00700 [Gaiellaceae bacterium]|nr:hypothetical protein [Gaiellaceae bacterium]
MGAILLLLLAAEGATIPWIGQLLTPHVFIGLLLIPPVALKMASTGWRFLRYYRHDPAYLELGPPHPFMRFLVAPVTVLTTITLFGTGVLLVIEHPHGGPILGLHKVSFVIWFGAMSLHVLAHLRTLGAQISKRVPGSALLAALVAVSIAAGVAFAVLELPAAHAWSHWHDVRR